MSVYLDASVLVSMFVADNNTPAAWRFGGGAPNCVISVWAVTEFSSALFLQVRKGRLAPDERSEVEARFDRWLTTRPDSVLPLLEDHQAARTMLRRASTPLRAPDALHLAICQRLGADLATFDRTMRLVATEFSISSIDL